jgi:hypothetical protein
MINKNGNPTSIPKETWDKLQTKGVLPETDASLVTDWFRVHLEKTDTKYGVLMYSPSLDVLRKTTFSEFYDGGVVD